LWTTTSTRQHHGSYRQRRELTRGRYMQAWHKAVVTRTYRTFPTVSSRRTRCRRSSTSTTCGRVFQGVTSGDQNVSVVVIAQDARHANRGKDTSASGRNDGAVVRRPGSHRRAMTTYASPLRQGASATARSHRGPRCHPPKFTTSASPPATPYLEPRGWQARR